jgi:hypothetical protein
MSKETCERAKTSTRERGRCSLVLRFTAATAAGDDAGSSRRRPPPELGEVATLDCCHRTRLQRPARPTAELATRAIDGGCGVHLLTFLFYTGAAECAMALWVGTPPRDSNLKVSPSVAAVSGNLERQRFWWLGPAHGSCRQSWRQFLEAELCWMDLEQMVGRARLVK